jgi:hypothetical protein
MTSSSDNYMNCPMWAFKTVTTIATCRHAVEVMRFGEDVPLPFMSVYLPVLPIEMVYSQQNWLSDPQQQHDRRNRRCSCW